MATKDHKRNEEKPAFKRTDSDKASQLGPSAPYKSSAAHPQRDAAYQSADNDMDRSNFDQANLKKDADQAQGDGNLSFPEGK